jgi:hypothetical protein
MKKEQIYLPFQVVVCIRPSRVGIAIGYPGEYYGSLELLEARKTRQMPPVPRPVVDLPRPQARMGGLFIASLPCIPVRSGWN